MVSAKSTSVHYGQPWVKSPAFDVSLIVGPPLLAALLMLALNAQLKLHDTVGPMAWLILVVGIDVAHVYASFFRTYWDKNMEARALLWIIPLGCWIAGALLYGLSPLFFWSTLAYVAVFHFVRQQYGFAMIYARGERTFPQLCRWIDRLTIYAATLYPLIFWHTHLPRNFNWFMEGDFIGVAIPWLSRGLGWIYILILLVFAIKEAWIFKTYKKINIPRNLIVLGTALSWYVGIVAFDNDLAFTFTNVVAHGIPYVALVWIYGRYQFSNRSADIKSSRLPIFQLKMIPLYVGVLFLLAYLEEGFWDGLIWQDHPTLFPSFQSLPLIHDKTMLTLLVPLLALPQATHYIFDAFIWRTQGNNSEWKKMLPTARTETQLGSRG